MKFYIKLAYMVLLTMTLFALPNVHAHNKVVVIPMAGDDVPAVLTPTSPIANESTDHRTNRGQTTVKSHQ